MLLIHKVIFQDFNYVLSTSENGKARSVSKNRFCGSDSQWENEDPCPYA